MRLVSLVERTGRHGFYLRVLEQGVLETEQEVRLVERPHPQWSVARAMAARRRAACNPAEVEALLRVPSLGDDWRDHLVRAFRRG